MSKVTFWVRDKNGKKKVIGERDIPKEEQEEIINYLDENYKKARVDDLK